MFLFLHSTFINIIIIASFWNQTLTWREDSLTLKLFIAAIEILKQISLIYSFTQQIYPALMPDIGVGTVVKAANRADWVRSTRPYNKPCCNLPLPFGSAFSSLSLILHVKPQRNVPSETASPPVEEEYACLS